MADATFSTNTFRNTAEDIADTLGVDSLAVAGGSPFSDLYGNGAIQDADVGVAGAHTILLGDAGTGSTNCRLDLSNSTIVLRKDSDQDDSEDPLRRGHLLKINGRGEVKVDSDTIGTIIMTDEGHQNSDSEIWNTNAIIDVAAGGRLRYAIPMIPRTASGTETAAQNQIRLNNSNSASNIRATFDAGPYAMYRGEWEDRVDSHSAAILTTGGKYLGSAVFNYTVSSDVLVRDILFRGGYVDFRPTGSWAPPNGGGFVSDSGVKLLGDLNTATDTNPVIWGNPDEDFLVQVDETPEGRTSGAGYFQYGVTSSATLWRSVFFNYNGAPWATQLAVHTTTNASLDLQSRLENHVFPTITTIDVVGELLEGTEIVYFHRHPVYDAVDPNNVIVAFPDTIFSNAEFNIITDANGYARLGNTNAVNSGPNNAIITEAFVTVGRPGSIDNFYAIPTDGNGAYANHFTHTYDVFRAGKQTEIGSTVFEVAPAAGNGQPKMGQRTLEDEAGLSLRTADRSFQVKEQKVTTVGVNNTLNALTVTDTDANEAVAYFGQRKLPISSTSGGSVTVTWADVTPDIPTGSVITVLSYINPSLPSTLDNLFDRTYFDSVTAKRAYDAQASTTVNYTDFQDYGAQPLSFFNQAVYERHFLGTTLAFNMGAGCPAAAEIWKGIQTTGNATFDGTITCGVNVDNILFHSGAVFTDNFLINTEERIKGTYTLAADDSVKFKDADISDLTLHLASGTAYVTLDSITTTPTTTGAGTIVFSEEATVTFDVGEAPEDSKTFFQGYAGTTLLNLTPTKVGNTLVYTTGKSSGEVFRWAFSYRGFEVIAGQGDSSTPTLVAQSTQEVDQDPSDALKPLEIALIDDTTVTGTTELQFLVPSDSVQVFSTVQANLIGRRLLEKPHVLQQIALGNQHANFLDFDHIGWVVRLNDDAVPRPTFRFVKTTDASTIVDMNVQVIGQDGSDQSLAVKAETVTNSNEVRFNKIATNNNVPAGVYDGVLADLKELNNQLQENLYSSFKTEL